MTTTLVPIEASRLRVLRVLREATQPLCAVEISRLASIPLQQTRNRISEAIQQRKIRNVGDLRNALYEMTDTGRGKSPEVECAAGWKHGTYTGEKPIPLRPGALDFLKCGTRNGDTVHEWRRPMLITRVES